MNLPHRVDRIPKVFQGVVRSEHANFAVAKWPTLVQIGHDLTAMQIDGLVGRSRIDPAAKIDLPKTIEVAPALDQRVDVLVVQVQRLGLDEGVLLAFARVTRMNVIDVQAAIDMLHLALDVVPAEQILVVENYP